jgi:two-component system sensor histidine kinase KdpD
MNDHHALADPQGPTVKRGNLRVYIGAAPGVGKTFAALEEIHDLLADGTDAVVGFVETHGRDDTARLLEGLEAVPTRTVEHKGVEFEEMDTKAILVRDPEVALIDDLAHTNVPGSGHPQRWQEVEDILASGIDVISTVNIQHFESLNDVVEEITGVSQGDVIPDEVVRKADEIHLVDLTQQAVRERMAAGKIYPVERIDAALANFFRPGNLGALRELALSWTAERVDEAVDTYRRAHGIDHQWETRERVVVGITGTAGGDDTIRRAARMAMRSKAEILGVHIRSTEGLNRSPTPELDDHRDLLERLGGQYHEVAHSDIGESLVMFAKAHNATQLVVGATRRNRLQEVVAGSVIQRVIRLAGDIDVHVISNPVRTRARVTARASPLPPRRRLWGWAIGASLFAVATLLMLGQREDFALQNVLLVYLSIAAAVAWIGGSWPALTAAVVGFVLGNYLFTPPYRTWTIANPADVFALITFVFLTGLIGFLVGTAARRSAEAATAKAEAETLVGLIGAGGEGSARKLIERLQVALDAAGITLFDITGGLLKPVATAGNNPPETVESADRTIAVGGEAIIAIVGGPLDPVDERLLGATATELATVIDRAEMANHVAEVDALERANELRIALLRAVSHDLRSPLSAIQASVTSMLQDDVQWPPEDQTEFLQTISEETERLNRIVSDLLDAGRIQTGTLQVQKRPAGIEDVVSTVATAFRVQGHRLSIDTEIELPDVSTDPVLLERIVENLVRNALDHSPHQTPVRVTAGVVGDRIDLRIIDRGPGIDRDTRHMIFEPYRTLDDSHMAGVGLGLAVAKGLADALGHQITVDDTPGGGTTMILSVEVAS